MLIKDLQDVKSEVLRLKEELKRLKEAARQVADSVLATLRKGD